MGLQSAMTTALTGLQAAETTIDVVGNNVANSGTTGFKESDVLFATQFLQTQSIGSTPSAERGGTNPRQIGLGVKVAAINPNFGQGTIEISANPLDVAIQGDGFLIVQGTQGNLYTRNGQIQTNSSNELVTVTGNRVLGYAIDEDFNIVNSGDPVPLTIPLGQSPVSQSTQTAFFTGVLTPLAEEGDTPSVIASEALGDALYTYPDDEDFGADNFQAVAGASDLTPGNYSYYVTFAGGGPESRPSNQIGPIGVGTGEFIRISDIPQPDPASDYTSIRIYRNLASTPSVFKLVTELAADGTNVQYDDTTADDDLGTEIDLMGAKASSGTLLTNVVVRIGDQYSQPFEEGVLSFEGRRGGRTLAAKELQITEDTTVQNLIDFMEQAFGISNDSGLPADLPTAGGTINTEGEIEFTSHAGLANAMEVSLSSFRLTPDGESEEVPVTITFDETTEANGPGSTTDFVVFDSLGIPITVRLTTVLEQKTGNDTTYRWFATSADNEPLPTQGVGTSVGTGTITYDGNGLIQGSPVATINIDRNLTASESPLVFDLDFSQVSGLALQNNLGESTSTLSMTRQDGFPPGTLSSFIVTESGLIRGIFSNGAERPLGQMRMARFANNGGLQQVGENLFATGVNSGEPILANPGEGGIGTLTAGALELSNTDIGQNLIELILASTQYRGGARVITTAQQLLDELLSLRR